MGPNGLSTAWKISNVLRSVAQADAESEGRSGWSLLKPNVLFGENGNSVKIFGMYEYGLSL